MRSSGTWLFRRNVLRNLRKAWFPAVPSLVFGSLQPNSLREGWRCRFKMLESESGFPFREANKKPDVRNIGQFCAVWVRIAGRHERSRMKVFSQRCGAGGMGVRSCRFEVKKEIPRRLVFLAI